MYPSNTYLNTSFQDNDFDPNLGIQDFSSSNSSCFFHFPSPLNQYDDDAIYLQQNINDMFHQNYDDQQIIPTNKMASIGNFSQNDHEANMKECLGTGGSTSDQQAVLVKKKVSKKDRHSKINTAHGPRDRRMRLSLDVARKFFWLQDMLGFDKASKTVQWLFKHSESAIKEFYGECPQMNKDSSVVTVAASSTSDGEAVSGIDQSLTDETAMTTKPSTCIKKTRNVRKPSYHFRTKESREKARERAKERTKEKKKKKKQKQQQLNDQQSTSLMTWNPYGAGKHLVGTSHHTLNYKDLVPSYESEELQYTKEQQMQNQGNIRVESINIGDPANFFLNGDWSPSTLFNYQQPSGISHENHSTDFQFYGT